jgi:hypothetical protein
MVPDWILLCIVPSGFGVAQRVPRRRLLQEMQSAKKVKVGKLGLPGKLKGIYQANNEDLRNTCAVADVVTSSSFASSKRNVTLFR